MLEGILEAFGLTKGNEEIVSFGSGLINHTWVVRNAEGQFILQRINHEVFKKPEDIAFNINALATHLRNTHPEYLFTVPCKTTNGDQLIFIRDKGYFRLFPFVEGSQTFDIVSSTGQAFEAAQQFGRFTKNLSSFECEQLKITLPNFHNLPMRFDQFTHAINEGNTERIKNCGEIIESFQQHYDIVRTYEKICGNASFTRRVTHHDTKISNVLFDKNNRGLCVIDLDTVMPGYFISDVGDMMRTYLSPVSEEEGDFSMIDIREDYFTAIAEGYLSEMNDELSGEEKAHFVYAGKFIIYMQGLRFLTDYLNNDIYYGSKYEGHNLLRAGNQLNLLKRLIEKEQVLVNVLSPGKTHYTLS